LAKKQNILEHDPYSLSELTIKEPPTKWVERLRYLGPGLILTVGIVGSGELIATTTLGATAGFVTLWVILISCVIKVALQLAIGRHTINTGESTMVSFNRFPGPKLGRANWSIWVWLFIMIFIIIQSGGIIGGAALVLNLAFPYLSLPIWTAFVTLLVALLVFKGYYRTVEKICLVLIGLFTLTTFTTVVFVQFTQYAMSWSDIFGGLMFRLPKAFVGVAIGAFGITGAGADEILLYNYWCLEKGYAAFTGPRQNSQVWVGRAKRWIKVMYMDAILSMIIYTTVTAAFYVLGAAILHGRGEVPKGFEMVKTLSRMYTETLGPWATGIFLIGAFVVLFGTLFSSLSAFTRIFSDAFGQIGLLNFHDQKHRSRAIGIFAWALPILWSILFLLIRSPVSMILLGGIANSFLLILVIYASIQFRYRRLSKELKPSTIFDTWFWFCCVIIAFLGIYGIVQLL